MCRFCIAAVTLTLVAASAIGVAGRDEGELPGATYVSGQTVEALGMLEPCEDKGCDQSVARTVEWTDRRLPPRMWERLAEAAYAASDPDGPANASIMSLAYRLEDSDGAWAGTGQGLVSLGLPDMAIDWDEQIVLVGEGAYRGLTAVLKREFADGQWTFEGYIFEGLVPPFPDPYEAGAFPQE